jgi:RHS repeat-associated protein
VGSDPASGGTWAYLSQDHLGSTRHLRGQDRASLGTYEYTPYGDPYIATGLDLPQKFTGHWQIPQAGLYYARYRMYAPALAHWLTRDPAGMVDGSDVFGYVGGEPVSYMDYLGLARDTGEKTRADCADLIRSILNQLPASCGVNSRETHVHIGNAITGLTSLLGIADGMSVRVHHITISLRACRKYWKNKALYKTGLITLVAHEAAHSIRMFDRVGYLFSRLLPGGIDATEEGWAQKQADACVAALPPGGLDL